jgi:FkbM family methyltransferase
LPPAAIAPDLYKVHGVEQDKRMELMLNLVRIAERLTRWRLARGVNVFHDIEYLLPAYTMGVIFDVGANVGQSARNYLRLFPLALVFCFEPASASFEELEKRTRHLGAKCYHLALSSGIGTSTLLSAGTDTMNRLLDSSEAAVADAPTETVAVTTLTEFCLSHGVQHISYLKIDTEGRDLDVLKGGKRLLAEQAIDFIEVETGVNSENHYHVPFETVKSFLEPRGYSLFGLYEQCEEWPTQAVHLRRVNSVYISRRLIEASRRDLRDG